MRTFLAFVCFLFCVLPTAAFALVNINTATLTELDSLPGVGPATAQSIVDNRPYASIQEVSRASGIGEPGSSSYENIKDLITVGEPQTQTAPPPDEVAHEAAPPPSTTTTASAPTPSYVPPPVPEVFADASDDRVVIVGADTRFDARAYNREKVTLEKVRFLWNFGDGSTAEGPAVLHHYDYPGRYVVILEAAVDKVSVSDRLIVTAEPAQLGFAVHSDGSVSIENKANRDLDLSGWLVRSFGQFFALPAHSVILKGESMRISQKNLKFYPRLETELQYPNGATALKANENTDDVAPTVTPSIAAQAASPQVKTQAVRAPEVVRLSAVAAEEVAPREGMSEPEPQRQVAAVATSSFASWWWLGALVLALLAGGAVVAIQRTKGGEWDIIEET